MFGVLGPIHFKTLTGHLVKVLLLKHPGYVCFVASLPFFLQPRWCFEVFALRLGLDHSVNPCLRGTQQAILAFQLDAQAWSEVSSGNMASTLQKLGISKRACRVMFFVGPCFSSLDGPLSSGAFAPSDMPSSSLPSIITVASRLIISAVEASRTQAIYAQS